MMVSAFDQSIGEPRFLVHENDKGQGVISGRQAGVATVFAAPGGPDSDEVLAPRRGLQHGPVSWPRRLGWAPLERPARPEAPHRELPRYRPLRPEPGWQAWSGPW